MSKAYKPQRLGGSIYLCIPLSFFSKEMLDDGVKVELMEKSDNYFIIKVKENEEAREYNLNIEAGRKDSQELGAATDIRKDGGFM